MIEDQIKTLIISDCKRRIFEESIPRIKQCIGLLTIDQICKKPNRHSNSVANLILHLCGNMRQYICHGIGGQEDTRKRSLEFQNQNSADITHDFLDKTLDYLSLELKKVLDQIIANDLILSKKVQGFDENVISILIHVVEHLSYHTGQIAFYTKLLLNIDLKFYGDLNLDITG